MSPDDYVIGGMDPNLRVTLYHALRALDDAGLMPGTTCAFRDDYRQTIAPELKAQSDRAYHGGSFRGGSGHGLESLASEDHISIETHRIAPIDGEEHAAHRLKWDTHSLPPPHERR
jgi:hypothetical protein